MRHLVRDERVVIHMLMLIGNDTTIAVAFRPLAREGEVANLVYVQMNYDNTLETYICTFFVKKGSNTFKPTFYLTLDLVGETQIKMNFAAEGDKAAQTYSERCPSMKAIVDELGSHTYNMSANSLLAPVNMTLTQSDAPANYSVWNL